MPGNCHFTTNERMNGQMTERRIIFNDFIEHEPRKCSMIGWKFYGEITKIITLFVIFFLLYSNFFSFDGCMFDEHMEPPPTVIAKSLLWLENKIQIYSQRRRKKKQTPKLDIESCGIVEFQSLLRWFKNRNSKNYPEIIKKDINLPVIWLTSRSWSSI